MSHRVIVVIGTRPEAIKLAPLAEALQSRGIAPSIIFTGQHPQLDPASFGLDRFSLSWLGCTGQKDPHAYVGEVTRALLPLMRSADLVIVQGDTSSAVGGALAAGLAEVPVAHVEAGLRSHDRRRPWPEEEFRLAIDSQAALLFAATELSVANLRRERVRGQIHLTGNTGIDAALRSAPASPAKSRDRELPRLLVTCHRRESWGGGFISIADALRRVAREKIANIDLVLHPSPALAAQMRLLLGGEPGIRLRDPCSHSELIREIVAADLVLSDSGGIQEEAAALGIPIVVLRERTERPEAIATGHLTLVDLNSLSIVETARTMLSRRPSDLRACPYGDGRAAPRIAAIVADWLTEKQFRIATLKANHAEPSAERRLAT